MPIWAFILLNVMCLAVGMLAGYMTSPRKRR